MNEFQWLRQTRALREDTPPTRDLWPGIAACLEPRGRQSPLHAWLPSMATAAIVVLSVMLGVTALHAPRSLTHDGVTAAQVHRWKPADPRLAGAAIEFQAAESEIRLAMAQTPDAPFLKRIHQRTQAQQWRLQHYAKRAP
jgi:hypothetical protein